MSISEDVILPDDPRAAERVTMTLWRSRSGRLYLERDRSVAMRDGATHIHCDQCGKPTPAEPYILCAECRAESDRQRWTKLESKPWDGTSPIAIMGSDTYFFDENDLDDYCHEHEVEPSELLLVHCRPHTPGDIDPYDFFCDYLPDDGSSPVLPDDVLDAFKTLNQAIENWETCLWYPGNVAVDLKT